jgi:chemotaxis regulatin CheY-phosphate phosphatase CheZ
MSKTVVAKSNANIAAEFTKLFGPPPLHKPEDEQIYDAILCGLTKDIGPLDTNEQILVRDLTDFVYEIQRLRRLSNELIREVHKQDLARQGQKLLADAQLRIDYIKADRESAARNPNLSAPEKASAESAFGPKIEQIQKEARQKLEELKKAEDGEIDEAALFRNWLPFYVAIQDQLTRLEGKFRNTLKFFEEYRQGLGQQLRKIVETILDLQPEEQAPARERELGFADDSNSATSAKGGSAKSG